ncbi:hypothetical protein BC629DRAFT_1442820 [Irpex lacteus]|nr:hypothetical protein BC629DRAFT_1442820 [Irpex lacteus]
MLRRLTVTGCGDVAFLVRRSLEVSQANTPTVYFCQHVNPGKPGQLLPTNGPLISAKSKRVDHGDQAVLSLMIRASQGSAPQVSSLFNSVAPRTPALQQFQRAIENVPWTLWGDATALYAGRRGGTLSLCEALRYISPWDTSYAGDWKDYTVLRLK